MKKSRLITTLTVSLGLLFALSSSVFAATTRYEAESAKVNGAGKITDGPAASGGKFVGDNNKVGSDNVEFTVNVTTAGTYKLTFGYATMNEGASNTIYVNDVKVADVPFPSTDHWLYNAPKGSEKTHDLQVTLKAGANDIKVGPNTGSVNIDYIEVSDVTATPAAATVTTNPKTGDVSLLPYLALMGLSSVGLIFRKKRA